MGRFGAGKGKKEERNRQYMNEKRKGNIYYIQKQKCGNKKREERKCFDGYRKDYIRKEKQRVTIIKNDERGNRVQ